ncbi:hypothetical protein Daura_48210 [Dactylosporangium aurantiacum]|uniref:Uncharacterized protein n=1 Tax=Dactylosporangium aurantiacum TaxID=35754 RepID=A0A9Q9MCN3_9ACTN|nr:hypothetical protein [Dactylosporangium aurantiacum]MDG6105274.1 hypothetical protein [Dactylosporangium aurantiacum]UWZ54173.1 hypothetical protein Daura_48210 [Dactylosporangium aurantiacum]
MNERKWWNGRWSRLVRRDVFVRNAADGRWQVELRRGGPDGRQRVRSFETEREAVGWVESTVLDPDAGWREIRDAAVLSVRKRRMGKSDSRRAGKVAQGLDRAG